MFVNFENEALTSQQVSLDPRLCHLDHIGQDAYVGVGNGLSSFNANGKAQSVVVRVDRSGSELTRKKLDRNSKVFYFRLFTSGIFLLPVRTFSIFTSGLEFQLKKP